MLEFLTANVWLIFSGAVAAIILYALISSADSRDTYPVDDPGFIHVGLNPVQLSALGPIMAKVSFLARVPWRKENETTYYAMTEAEFLKLYGEIVNYGRAVIAEQARINAAFLPGQALTLAELIVELRPFKDRISPEPSDAEMRQHFGQVPGLENVIRSE